MFALDEALLTSMCDSEFVEAMRDGIDAFVRYRETMPLVTRSYTRTQLRHLPHYELVGMLWAPGSRSPIHDHGSSRCWVVVLSGMLEVENYDRLDNGGARATLCRDRDRRISRGELDYRANWRDMHRVANSASVPAYSLQLYAAPLTTYNVILDENSGTCITTTSQFDSRFDL